MTLPFEERAGATQVGDVVLWSTSHEHGGGELGFLLHPDHHGRGYATEAAELVYALLEAEWRALRASCGGGSRRPSRPAAGP